MGRKLLCEFGTVGGGDEVARISFKVARERLSLEDADRLLCGKRIHGRISCRAEDEDGSQRKIGADDPQIEGTFDCKNVKATPKFISGSLRFMIDEQVEAALLKLAKRHGQITINKAIEPDDKEKVPKRQADVDGQQQLAGTVPPRPKLGDKIEEHFSGAVLRKATDAGLKTIKQLVILRDNSQLEEHFTTAQAGQIVAVIADMATKSAGS